MSQNDASTSAIARATSTSCSVWRRNSGRTSWSGVASTASRETGRARSRPSWARCPSGDGTALVQLSYGSLRILPPIGKQKRYPALTLTVLHAREPDEPADRPRIDWRLVTDLPVTSNRAAVEKLRWYALRWKIEVFCILSWRVFWMTMLNRSAPDVTPELALTDIEVALLDRLVPDKAPAPPATRTLASCLTKIARLRGYLARAGDPPPGNTVMWRGLSRLTDITLGASLAPPAPRCG